MKTFITVAIFLFLQSSVTNASMDFTKGGVDYKTTAADGVYLRGEDEVIMFHSLNVQGVKRYGYLSKTLSLDGGSPATRSLITCSVQDGGDYSSELKSAECYMGIIPQR